MGGGVGGREVAGARRSETLAREPLLLAVVAVSRLLGLFSTVLAIAAPEPSPSRVPASEVAEAARSVSTQLVTGVVLSLGLAALAALLFVLACWLRPGALAAGRGPRVLALALVLATLGWTAMTASRVQADLVYLVQIAVEGSGAAKPL